MKKYLSFFLAALFAVSCLNGGSFSQTYDLISGFEYNNIDFEEMFDSDKKYYEYKGIFTSGDFAFSSKIDTLDKDSKVYEFQGGFYLSYAADSLFYPVKDTVWVEAGTPLLDENNQVVMEDHKINPYSVCDWAGAFKSKTFTIFDYTENMPSMDMFFVYFNLAGATCTMKECYVCNTTEVAHIIAYGTETQPAFQSGDYLRIIATAFVDGKESTKASFYLADFRDGKKDFVKGWTKWEFDSIGVMDYLDFKIESSRTDIPLRCCFDSIRASVSIVSE